MHRILIRFLQVLVPSLQLFSMFLFCKNRKSSQSPPSLTQTNQVPQTQFNVSDKDDNTGSSLSQLSQAGSEVKTTASTENELVPKAQEAKNSLKQDPRPDHVVSDGVTTIRGERAEALKKSYHIRQKICQVLQDSPCESGFVEKSCGEEDLMRSFTRRKPNIQQACKVEAQERVGQQNSSIQAHCERGLLKAPRKIEFSNSYEVQSEDENEQFRHCFFKELKKLKEIKPTKSIHLYKGESMTEEETKRRKASDDQEIQEALNSLRRFNFAEIKFTKDGKIYGKRRRICVEQYEGFCKVAKVDPLDYYQENYCEFVSEGKKERILRILKEKNLDAPTLKFRKNNLPYISSIDENVMIWLTTYGYYSKTMEL